MTTCYWVAICLVSLEKLTCRTESTPLKNLTVHSIVIVNKIYSANPGFVTMALYALFQKDPITTEGGVVFQINLEFVEFVGSQGNF